MLVNYGMKSTAEISELFCGPHYYLHQKFHPRFSILFGTVYSRYRRVPNHSREITNAPTTVVSTTFLQIKNSSIT